MPARKFGNENRYGFNGKERDKDMHSLTAYDYGFRIYNPAIGKFLSVDPLTQSYPFYTPYQYAANSPILSVDIDGLESNNNVNVVENKSGEVNARPWRERETAKDFMTIKSSDGTLYAKEYFKSVTWPSEMVRFDHVWYFVAYHAGYTNYYFLNPAQDCWVSMPTPDMSRYTNTIRGTASINGEFSMGLAGGVRGNLGGLNLNVDAGVTATLAKGSIGLNLEGEKGKSLSGWASGSQSGYELNTSFGLGIGVGPKGLGLDLSGGYSKTWTGGFDLNSQSYKWTSEGGFYGNVGLSTSKEQPLSKNSIKVNNPGAGNIQAGFANQKSTSSFSIYNSDAIIKRNFYGLSIGFKLVVGVGGEVNAKTGLYYLKYQYQLNDKK